MSKRLLFTVGITFIAIGILVSTWVILIFSSEVTLELILGLLGGLSLAFVFLFGYQKYLGFVLSSKTDDNALKQSISTKLSKWLELPSETILEDRIVERLLLFIRGTLATWSLFGAFAVITSVAIYYATLMQANKLESQNIIIKRQNILLCQQNIFLESSNKFNIYNRNNDRIDGSINQLRSLIDNIITIKNQQGDCRVLDELSFPKLRQCLIEVSSNMVELNSDIRLFGDSIYIDHAKPIKIFEAYRSELEQVLELLKPQYAENQQKEDLLKLIESHNKYNNSLTNVDSQFKSDVKEMQSILAKESLKLEESILNCEEGY